MLGLTGTIPSNNNSARLQASMAPASFPAAVAPSSDFSIYMKLKVAVDATVLTEAVLRAQERFEILLRDTGGDRYLQIRPKNASDATINNLNATAWPLGSSGQIEFILSHDGTANEWTLHLSRDGETAIAATTVSTAGMGSSTGGVWGIGSIQASSYNSGRSPVGIIGPVVFYDTLLDNNDLDAIIADGTIGAPIRLFKNNVVGAVGHGYEQASSEAATQKGEGDSLTTDEVLYYDGSLFMNSMSSPTAATPFTAVENIVVKSFETEYGETRGIPLDNTGAALSGNPVVKKGSDTFRNLYLAANGGEVNAQYRIGVIEQSRNLRGGGNYYDGFNAEIGSYFVGTDGLEPLLTRDGRPPAITESALGTDYALVPTSHNLSRYFTGSPGPNRGPGKVYKIDGQTGHYAFFARDNDVAGFDETDPLTTCLTVLKYPGAAGDGDVAYEEWINTPANLSVNESTQSALGIGVDLNTEQVRVNDSTDVTVTVASGTTTNGYPYESYIDIIASDMVLQPGFSFQTAVARGDVLTIIKGVDGTIEDITTCVDTDLMPDAGGTLRVYVDHPLNYTPTSSDSLYGGPVGFQRLEINHEAVASGKHRGIKLDSLSATSPIYVVSRGAWATNKPGIVWTVWGAGGWGYTEQGSPNMDLGGNRDPSAATGIIPKIVEIQDLDGFILMSSTTGSSANVHSVPADIGAWTDEIRVGNPDIDIAWFGTCVHGSSTTTYAPDNETHSTYNEWMRENAADYGVLCIDIYEDSQVGDVYTQLAEGLRQDMPHFSIKGSNLWAERWLSEDFLGSALSGGRPIWYHRPIFLTYEDEDGNFNTRQR